MPVVGQALRLSDKIKVRESETLSPASETAHSPERITERRQVWPKNQIAAEWDADFTNAQGLIQVLWIIPLH
jgi:hypothetical protein